MARFSRRLPVYSSHYEDNTWTLAEGDYQVLQDGYHDISEDAREDLLRICRAYLHWKRVEQHVGRMSDADAAWKELRITLENFAQFSSGGGVPDTEAGRYVADMVNTNLSSASIPMTEQDFYPKTLDSSLWGADTDRKDAVLTVRSSFMTRFAYVLWTSITLTDRQLQEAQGFAPGTAFADWLMDMKAWAVENSYDTDLSTSSRDGRFPTFLFKLNHILPAEFRDSVNSVEALSKQLQRKAR